MKKRTIEIERSIKENNFEIHQKLFELESKVASDKNDILEAIQSLRDDLKN